MIEREEELVNGIDELLAKYQGLRNQAEKNFCNASDADGYDDMILYEELMDVYDVILRDLRGL